MRPDIRYVNNRGRQVSLSSDGIVVSATPLMEWAYDVNEVNGRIGSFTRDIETVKLPLVTYEPGRRGDLYEVTTVDRVDMQPGRLYVGDWYIQCYLTASSVEYWWTDRGLSRYDLELTVEDKTWHRESTYVLSDLSGADGADFPYDFAYDFGYRSERVVVENEGFMPADLIIRVYGECEDPRVTVAGNTYGADVSLGSGDYLTIDTAGKRVYVTRYDGDVENAFPDIYGEYTDGSGSYVFQRISSGIKEVTRSGSFDLDVVVVESRDQPGVVS